MMFEKWQIVVEKINVRQYRILQKQVKWRERFRRRFCFLELVSRWLIWQSEDLGLVDFFVYEEQLGFGLYEIFLILYGGNYFKN